MCISLKLKKAQIFIALNVDIFKTGKTQKFRLQKQKKFGKLINCDILNSLLLFLEKLDRFTVRLAGGMNEKQGPEDHKEVKQDEQV